MPRGDGTGPMGMGPMTGRAAGFCAGSGIPGFMNSGLGRGLGIGRGFGRSGGGRGCRNQFYATGLPGWKRFGVDQQVMSEFTPEQEKLALKSQAEALQSQVNAIQKRLADLGVKEEKTSK